MSVQSHLESLASKLNLKQDEKDKVKKSIDTLSDRLDRYFNGSLKNIFNSDHIQEGLSYLEKQTNIPMLII